MHNKVPMLKFLTSTRTVRILWSEYNVKNSMAEYFLERDQSLEKWNSIEESLELKIENDLILPKTLKILLSSLVKPIGGRINHVIRQIYDNKYLPNHFMSMISWTILGIIDEKKTAEAVIKDENLSLTKRYEIACTYCLENEIPMLWSKLPKENKTHYFDARAPLYTFPIYWAYHMKMELNILDKKIQEKFPRSSNSHCFGVNFAFATVNLPAFEYFLGKFSAKEKDAKFQAFFRYLEVTEEARSIDTYTCDITYFLLSQMNENQRTYIFKNYAFYILKRFLEFPYQGFFLEIESIMLKNLTDDNKEALKSHELYKETGKYFVFRTYSKNNALWNF